MAAALESDQVLSEVCRLLEAGRSLDPALVRKVDEEAEAIRGEIRERLGTIEVAVDLVRESRTRE